MCAAKESSSKIDALELAFLGHTCNMPDPINTLTSTLEVFSSSIDDFITSLGQGIATAQRNLDANSLQLQQVLDADPVAAQYGLQAVWYQFPRVDLELKLSFTVTQDQSSSTSSQAALRAPVRLPNFLSTQIRPIRIVAQPVSASYQTHFNYDAQAASTLTLSIVPVPSPRAGAQGVQPLMTEEQVRAAAFASSAKFVFLTDKNSNVIKDAQGVPLPANVDAQNNALRLLINFNGAAGLWYVMQYAPFNQSIKPVVVVVDDVVGSRPGVDPKTAVRVLSTP